MPGLILLCLSLFANTGKYRMVEYCVEHSKETPSCVRYRVASTDVNGFFLTLLYLPTAAEYTFRANLQPSLSLSARLLALWCAKSQLRGTCNSVQHVREVC